MLSTPVSSAPWIAPAASPALCMSTAEGTVPHGFLTPAADHIRPFAYRRRRRLALLTRYSVGDLPENLLNTRLNCERDWNPTANAISLMRRSPFRSKSHAVVKRMRATY